MNVRSFKLVVCTTVLLSPIALGGSVPGVTPDESTALNAAKVSAWTSTEVTRDMRASAPAPVSNLRSPPAAQAQTPDQFQPGWLDRAMILGVLLVLLSACQRVLDRPVRTPGGGNRAEAAARDSGEQPSHASNTAVPRDAPEAALSIPPSISRSHVTLHAGTESREVTP